MREAAGLSGLTWSNPGGGVGGGAGRAAPRWRCPGRALAWAPGLLVILRELGRVAGYASFGPWRPHDGFRHTVENSVYVSPDHRGSGIGRSLMKALIERARMLDKHVMVAFIESENRASVHMHQQLGFIHVGQMRQVGCKFGRWLDLTMMQLTLNRTSKP